MFDHTFFNTIIEICQNSPVGKLLPNALYVHQCALHALDPILQDYERRARIAPKIQLSTLVKFSTDRPKISYLFYPDFDQNPHPALICSIVVNLETVEWSEWNYQTSDNPPVLHRKETFVTPDYPHYAEFAQLTAFEVALGLLDNARYIGTRQEWQQRLNYHRIGFEGHRLICPIGDKCSQSILIDRHKAALVRKTLSRPVRLAIESALFIPNVTTFFDYGCGYGGDIARIGEQGYSSSGWDPYYRPESPLVAADIVNLGYVINVIEDIQERREALIKAWELTRQVLIVAAQVLVDDCDRGLVAYGDGIITNRNTFQKYYDQEELKIYIDQVLQVEAIPVGLGIYFVFREAAQAEAFRLSRYRSRTATPKIQANFKRFEDYEDLLNPLIEFYTNRGRLPVKGELSNEADIKAEFATFRRAFQVILQATQVQEWETIAEQRRQDLLLYLALSKFSHRPSSRKISSPVREDFKALFGGYQSGCLLADHLLMNVGKMETIAKLCTESSVGKKFRNSLIIHISALENLPLLLRLYEGCASQTIGRLDDANVIKLSFRQPKITYLYYPAFDTYPHPMLQTSMEIHLGDIQVRYQDFIDDDNPPILHEKEKLVTHDYIHYEKFAKLTQQEKDAGLLKDFQAINHLQGWLQCLANHCVTIKGHQLQVSRD